MDRTDGSETPFSMFRSIRVLSVVQRPIDVNQHFSAGAIMRLVNLCVIYLSGVSVDWQRPNDVNQFAFWHLGPAISILDLRQTQHIQIN